MKNITKAIKFVKTRSIFDILIIVYCAGLTTIFNIWIF